MSRRLIALALVVGVALSACAEVGPPTPVELEEIADEFERGDADAVIERFALSVDMYGLGSAGDDSARSNL